MIRFDTSGANGVISDLQAAHADVHAQASAIVAQQGRRLLADVRRRASRRPGPRVITGRYVNSWRMEISVDQGGRVRADVGTDHPAGFRLERGFHGTDADGRNFREVPGHPHVAPAARAAEEPFRRAMTEIVK